MANHFAHIRQALDVVGVIVGNAEREYDAEYGSEQNAALTLHADLDDLRQRLADAERQRDDLVAERNRLWAERNDLVAERAEIDRYALLADDGQPVEPADLDTDEGRQRLRDALAALGWDADRIYRNYAGDAWRLRLAPRGDRG